VHLLQNNAYLPLGFLAQPELADLDFSEHSNAFGFQNELFASATGLDRQVWRRIGGEYLHIEGTGTNVTDTTGSGTCIYQDSETNSYVTYQYIAPRDGFMCIHLNLPKRNTFYVSINGLEKYRETISLPQMLAVGDVLEGDLVEIRVQCKAGESSTMSIAAAILDNELFYQGYQVLAASRWELSRFENTLVEGSIACNRDGLFYTSIPQNGNWQVMVDGSPAHTVLVGDAMIAVPLERGVHVVTFRYHNSAFSLGWKITLGCALAFGLLIPCYYPELKKKLPTIQKKK